MTKQQMRIFTISVFVVFGFLYTAVLVPSIVNKVGNLQTHVDDLGSQIEELQSQ